MRPLRRHHQPDHRDFLRAVVLAEAVEAEAEGEAGKFFDEITYISGRLTGFATDFVIYLVTLAMGLQYR